jgi:glyoxylase-like metal-dependent hydrolase (beta-lactamase superfamily II)
MHLNMNLYKIETGNFKLDGGAMFGVVPKSLWNQVYPADENNLCNLSMRCLLIETGNKKILIDAGLGNKLDEKFLSHYFLNGDFDLEKSLSENGFSRNDITDVVLTHLHFDHCGGGVFIDNQNTLQLTFPKATYWVGDAQYKWAIKPNQREKASYFRDNIKPIVDAGKMRFVEKETRLCPEVLLRLFYGHTDGLIIPLIKYKDKTLVFTADLLPTAAHIPASWVCGYDTRPLISMEERNLFLSEAVQKNYVLFFEHDINVECCTLKETEKGIRMDKSFTLEKFLKIP